MLPAHSAEALLGSQRLGAVYCRILRRGLPRLSQGFTNRESVRFHLPRTSLGAPSPAHVTSPLPSSVWLDCADGDAPRLRGYDGTEGDEIYLAVRGVVFDVTPGLSSCAFLRLPAGLQGYLAHKKLRPMGTLQ